MGRGSGREGPLPLWMELVNPSREALSCFLSEVLLDIMHLKEVQVYE